ncbi:MAG: ABC transporter ATP-binding protein [Alphaproteobacteria bacterium]|nr:ABC transporter ATP-binding protein [Alphaproteobacteria bacterium]
MAQGNGVATTGAGDAPVLQIENLGISYFIRAGEIPAVPNFSLTVRRGESYGLVGESGCGKSTVAMAIMRYLGTAGRIVRGRILFEGRDMTTLSEDELRKIRGSRIAMVYQEPFSALNPCMTVGRQLMEVPMVHEGVNDAEAYERSLKILRDVNMPDPGTVMSRYPHQISGGQQQRVVIGMAMLTNPSLLLLDEPTTALDVTIEAAVLDLIAELRQRYGTALLYISHNLGVIRKVCDRVGVMYSGELVEEGTIDEIFSRPRHPYTFGLFNCIPTIGADKRARSLIPIPGQVSLPHQRPPGCVFAPRCDHAKPGLCDVGAVPYERLPGSESHGIRCRRWSEIELKTQTRTRAPESAEAALPVLEVRDMSKFYELRDSSIRAMLMGGVRRNVKANELISFDALKARTVAIVGESGCGKSTFAKVLTGLEQATAGEIMLNGKNIAIIPVEKRQTELIRALQMVFQNPDGTLNPSHTVGSAIGRVIRKFGIETEGPKVRARVAEMLDIVRLPAAFAGRKPRQLSGGQKQRIAVARAFAGRPEIVIADEPVSALDVSVQAAVINLLMEVQERYGTTLLFISHDLGVVRYLADHIVVMYLGQVMEAGPAAAVFQPPYHPYTEALLSAVPIADPTIKQQRVRLTGELPSIIDPPKGCRFCTRCPRRIGSICDSTPPPEQDVAPGHRIRCHIPAAELRLIPPVFTQVTAAE